MTDPNLELSERQREIVAMDADRLAIVAGAGSGKTRVLAARYVRQVVERGLMPRQILTLTFTVKAAGEMRERIVKQLLASQRPDAAREAETGPICTIDAWVQEALRSHAILAGVDPEFGVLDSMLESSFFQDAFQEALAEAQEEDLGIRRLMGQMANEPFKGRRRPYAALRERVRSWVSAMRASTHDRADIARWNSTAEALQQRFEELASQALPPDVVAQMESEEGTFAQRAMAAHKALGRRLPGWLKAEMPNPLDHLEPSAALARLSLLTWERLEARMWKEQRFDFTAQTRLLLDVMEREPAFRERLRRAYPVVMVDEAQDVSPSQYLLLDKLDPEQLVWIGDPQQSIYSFREADVGLFLRTVEGCVQAQMGENKRSVVSIQRFVDTACGSWWSGEYRPVRVEPVDLDEDKTPWYPDTEIWDLDPRDWRSGLAQLVAKMNPGKWSEVAILTQTNRESERIEEELRRLGVPCKLAAGRRALFTRLEARDLANVLRALADPADDFSLTCVLRGPLVGISLDSLTALVRSGTVSEVLETFAPKGEADQEKLTRFRSWFDPISRLGDRLPAAEVLSRLMAQPGFLESLVAGPSGTRVLANLRRIHQMAIARPELGPLEFADQIQEIQQLRYPMDEPSTNELDQDEATILTVFKSKGLEFGTVVVADLFGKPIRRSDHALLVDRTSGLAVFETATAKPLAHRWLRDQENAKDVAETQRLMYVAMTRAKNRLVLAATSKRGETVAAALVKGFGRSTSDWARYSVVRSPDQPEPEPGA